MATIINVLFEGEVVPVPIDGITFISQLVKNAAEELGIPRRGLNVYRISRDDAKALKRNRDHVPALKEEVDEVDALDTALFAGGAHLILLERKPGELVVVIAP